MRPAEGMAFVTTTLRTCWTVLAPSKLQLGGDEDELRATIIAAQAALEITLSDLAGTSPLLLRVDERYSRHLAGMVPPPQNCENLAKEFRCLLLHIRQSRQVWMAGWRRGRLYWWGDAGTLCVSPSETTLYEVGHVWTCHSPYVRRRCHRRQGAHDVV